jgi:hypothetical protein
MEARSGERNRLESPGGRALPLRHGAFRGRAQAPSTVPGTGGMADPTQGPMIPDLLFRRTDATVEFIPLRPRMSSSGNL